MDETLKLVSILGIVFTAIATWLNWLEHRQAQNNDKRVELTEILDRVTNERDQLLTEKKDWGRERDRLNDQIGDLNQTIARLVLHQEIGHPREGGAKGITAE